MSAPGEPPADVVRAQRARTRAVLASVEPRRGWVDRAIRVGVRAGFALVGWRVRAEGLERLPRGADGRVAPCVVGVAPHRGWIDPFLLLFAWPDDAPRLAWFGDARTMARSAWRRRLLPRLGMIPIPPEVSREAVREHLADAAVVLGRGCCIVVFPEKGRPSPRGHTRTIAGGAAWLASAGGVHLVPVAIGGYLETGLGTVYRLRVLEPIKLSGPAPDTPAGRHAARSATAALDAALGPAVAELEGWSARANGRRPLPGLRRLFR